MCPLVVWAVKVASLVVAGEVVGGVVVAGQERGPEPLLGPAGEQRVGQAGRP